MRGDDLAKRLKLHFLKRSPAFCLLLLAPTVFAQTYWSETGLKASALQEFISTQSCNSTSEEIQACWDALESLLPPQNPPLRLSSLLLDYRAENSTRHLGPTPSVPFDELREQVLRLSLRPENESDLVAQAINTYLQKTIDPQTGQADPYSGILPKRLVENLKKNNSLTYQGTGALSVWDPTVQALRIYQVIEGTPAARSELKPQDRIVAIEGQLTSELGEQRSVALLNQPREHDFSISISRAGKNNASTHHNLSLNNNYGDVEKISLSQIKLDLPRVSANLITHANQKVGWIRIVDFATDQTCDLVKKAVDSLVAENISSLALDLRDNPGGQMEAALCVAGLFLKPSTPLLYRKTTHPAWRELEIAQGTPETVTYKNTAPAYFKIPLVVWVNAKSMSSAEIVAGILKTLKRARIIGEKTFGKGSVQQVVPWTKLPESVYFKFTTHQYFFARKILAPQVAYIIGTSPDGIGITPDFPLRTSDDSEENRIRIMNEALRLK